MASREGTQKYAKEKCGLRIGEAVSESSRRSTANAKCGNVARFPWRIPRLVFGLRNEQSGTGVSPVNDQTEERRARRPYPTISIRALGICAGARALSSGILLSRMSKDFVWSESGGGSERGSEKGLGRGRRKWPWTRRRHTNPGFVPRASAACFPHTGVWRGDHSVTRTAKEQIDRAPVAVDEITRTSQPATQGDL